MSSRKLADLHPDLFPKAAEMIRILGEQGIDYLLYCSYRTDVEQDLLYKIGRTMPGKILTNAKGGQSKHNFMIKRKPASKAWDGVPLIGGKPLWSMEIMDTTGRRMLNPIWAKVGEIGEMLGLQWGYRWKGKLREGAHFELKG